jgi:predicted transcriptional regulator
MGKVARQAKASQNAAKGLGMAASALLTDGNHGHNPITMQPQNPTPSPERTRLSVDLSPVISSHLDHISDVTGVTKSGIIAGALLDALPALLARADGLKKRHQELAQVKKK